MIEFAIAAALPVLFGIKNFEGALLLTSSVLAAVLFVEFIFFISRKLKRPLKSALVTFTLLAYVLIPLSIAWEWLWPEAWQSSGKFFPVVYPGAFLLARISTLGTNPLAFRARIWAGFACLGLLFGAWCEKGPLFQQFPAGVLWLSALFALGGQLLNRKESS